MGREERDGRARGSVDAFVSVHQALAASKSQRLQRAKQARGRRGDLTFSHQAPPSPGSRLNARSRSSLATRSGHWRMQILRALVPRGILSRTSSPDLALHMSRRQSSNPSMCIACILTTSRKPQPLSQTRQFTVIQTPPYNHIDNHRTSHNLIHHYPNPSPSTIPPTNHSHDLPPPNLILCEGYHAPFISHPFTQIRTCHLTM